VPIAQVSEQRSGEARATRPGVHRRPVQRVAAAILLLVVAPVLAVLVLLVRLDSGGAGIFRQSRLGLGGRPFVVYKIRTMCDGAPCDGRKKAVGDDRVTRFGRLLRQYSFDELPQLLNVVRGEMALVGPRPLLASDTPDTWAYRRRLEVLPGMTGLWQVSGRCDLSPEESLAIDISYVDSRSPFLDLKILARTVPAVLAMKGAY
jgi:lipopolysaccharide/colanic/teichoic acid biosynthesis glycosyltransferase